MLSFQVSKFNIDAFRTCSFRWQNTSGLCRNIVYLTAGAEVCRTAILADQQRLGGGGGGGLNEFNV
jgi:hypothetical protein